MITYDELSMKNLRNVVYIHSEQPFNIITEAGSGLFMGYDRKGVRRTEDLEMRMVASM